MVVCVVGRLVVVRDAEVRKQHPVKHKISSNENG